MTQVSIMSDEAGGKINGGVVVQEAFFKDGAYSTTTATIPLDNTVPQNTEGAEFMSLAFTPTDANNKLVITVVVHLAHSAASSYLIAALFKDSGANAIASSYNRNSADTNRTGTLSFTHEILAGSTSTQTFSVRCGGNTAGTTGFNGNTAPFLGGTLASSIHIREVSPYKILPSGTLQGIVLEGTGTPEGVVTANVGVLFTRTDGGASTTLYVKENGTGNTGWVAK